MTAKGGSIADSLVAEADSPAAPPRSNGELVFGAPWESRAFGVAVALAEAQTVEWEQFRNRLIAEIGDWDPETSWSYYERWLASLERLLVESSLLSEAEIEARAEQLAEHDAHEHDHEHGHDHHHDHHH
jgi:nitrile hydratase accessory protein